jgi:hypothetical protein
MDLVVLLLRSIDFISNSVDHLVLFSYFHKDLLLHLLDMKLSLTDLADLTSFLL